MLKRTTSFLISTQWANEGVLATPSVQERQHSLRDADSILKNAAVMNQLDDTSAQAPVSTEAPVMAPTLDGSAPPALPNPTPKPQPATPAQPTLILIPCRACHHRCPQQHCSACHHCTASGLARALIKREWANFRIDS